MKIKWIGKFSGKLPTSDLPDNAKPLGKITNKSVLLFIPIFAIIVLLWIIKRNIIGIEFNRIYFLVGIGIALVFSVIHELLHAVCFSANAEIEMFYTNMGLGTTSVSPLKKSRFIIMNLFPSIILGIIPLLIWLFIPQGYALVSSILFAFGFFHFGASYGDFQNVINAIRFVPNNAIMQISGEQFYWYV